MTLPASGQLSLSDIYNELYGSPPGANDNVSLDSMGADAGFSQPVAISDFYGYTAQANVTWNEPTRNLASNITITSLQYRIGAGAWTNFSGSYNQIVAFGTTVGIRVSANFSSLSNYVGVLNCGTISAPSAYGNNFSGTFPGPGSLSNFTLDGVSTTGRLNMVFGGSLTQTP